MTTRHRFVRINGVDRAGSPWIEVTLLADAPAVILQRLDHLRSLRPDRVYWADDPDDPERGDIQDELEEMAEDQAMAAQQQNRWVVNKPEEPYRPYRPLEGEIRRRVWIWRLKSFLGRISWWEPIAVVIVAWCVWIILTFLDGPR